MLKNKDIENRIINVLNFTNCIRNNQNVSVPIDKDTLIDIEDLCSDCFMLQTWVEQIEKYIDKAEDFISINAKLLGNTYDIEVEMQKEDWEVITSKVKFIKNLTTALSVEFIEKFEYDQDKTRDIESGD